MDEIIRSLADVERLERTPLADRMRGETVYDMLADVVARQGAATALTALAPDDPLGEARSISFDALLENVNRAANLLRSLGLGPDDAVLDLLPLTPEGFYLKIAAETVAIACPVNPMLEIEHLRGIAEAAGARVVVAPGPALNAEVHAKAMALAEALPQVSTVLLLGGEDAGPAVRALEAALAEQPADAVRGGTAGALDDTVGYYHTGGTTGLPKLAPHTQRMRAVQAVSTALMLGYGPGDRILLGLPMFHIAGSVICGLLPLLAGAEVVLADPRGFRAPEVVAQFWRIIERRRITFTVCVPTTLAAVVDAPAGDADLSSLRQFGVGGAPSPRQMLDRASKIAGIRVTEGFGMTELGSITAFQPQHGPKSVGSVGIRAPYVEVKIAAQRPDGSVAGEAGVDEIGVLCFRGPCVTPGYLGGRAQAESFTPDGWFVSGDLARIDANGEIWITGRAKDMIIRGGHNIDPMVAEEALDRHPAVLLAAAVGRPDAHAGEVPVAYVQLRPGMTAEPADLVDWARRTVAERAAAPAEVVIMEALPMTGFDKVFKPALRRDAVRRAYDAALRSSPETAGIARIDVVEDGRRGMLARVLLAPGAPEDRVAAIRDRLAPFHVPFDVVSADPAA